MTDLAAIKATFVDFRLIKGRKQCSLVFEVPLEEADKALEALGGIPRPDESRWVGIALLNLKAASEPPKPDKRKFNDLPLVQQCGIRCNDESFARFLLECHNFNGDPADFVRDYCAVKSRKDIVAKTPAARVWHELNVEFDLWMRNAL